MHPKMYTRIRTQTSRARFESLERRALLSAGDLDLSFGGGDGIASHPDAGISVYPAALAAAPDGKLVAVGDDVVPGRGRDFVIARFNADGTLDTSFGTRGYQYVDFGGDDEAVDVEVLPDGKIVVAGSAPGAFGVARLNADGSLDTTFDGDGRAAVGIAGRAVNPASVALAPGGKVVVGGSGYVAAAQRTDMAAARFNADGSPDTSFDGDGTAVVALPEGTAFGGFVDVADDGKVVLAGTLAPQTSGGPGPAAVARLNADGTPDASFSGDGRAILPDPNPAATLYAKGAEVIAGGKVVLGYELQAPNGPFDALAMRLNADGSLDNTFGVGGRRQVATATNDGLEAFAVQPDGKLLLGIRSFQVSDSIARLTVDGAIDTTFGGDGFVSIPPEGGTFGPLVDIVAQPTTNRVVALAWRYYAGDPQFGLFAFTPAGEEDPTFRFTVEPQNPVGRTGLFFDVLHLADGKLLAVGLTNVDDVYLARFNADGSFDTTFSGDGKVAVDLGGRLTRLAVRPDGKIVGHGEVLARFNTDGTLDTSFGGGDGIVVSPEDGDGLALQPDGKILVTEGRRVARYNADGSLDTTFGNGGRVIFDQPIGRAPWDEEGDPYDGFIPLDVAWQASSGKIVAGGQTPGFGTITDFAAVRLNLDGSLDTTFANGLGMVSNDTGDIDFGGRIDIAPDGTIYMAGEEEDEDPTLVRFEKDGRSTSDWRLPWLGDLSDVSVGPDGDVVVVGDAEYSADPVHTDIRVARFNPDFTFDSTFGGPRGVQTDVFGESEDFPYGVVVAPDGDVIVAGRASGAPVLLRYDGGGSHRVQQAYVRGSAWSDRFLSGSTYGYWLQPRLDDNVTLPWINLDQIALKFNRAVDVKADDLTVTGVNVARYGVTGFRYDPDTRTAVWTLDRRIGADKVLAVLNSPGIDAFPLRFNVLPGDVDFSGGVVADDASAVKRRFFTTSAGPYGPTGYTPYHDVDGSGQILANDFAEVKRRFFTQLPAGEPAATSLATPSTAPAPGRVRPVRSELFGANAILA